MGKKGKILGQNTRTGSNKGSSIGYLPTIFKENFMNFGATNN
jgi:hypothetical protein